MMADQGTPDMSYFGVERSGMTGQIEGLKKRLVEIMWRNYKVKMIRPEVIREKSPNFLFFQGGE